MKRIFLAALLLAACKGNSSPQIDSFTVDDANPTPGKAVHLSYSVRSAKTVSILPEPGEVTASPVTVTPPGTTTYTLRASNQSGTSEKSLTVAVRTYTAASVAQFQLTPSQAPAGTQRTLRWIVRAATAAPKSQPTPVHRSSRANTRA